MEYNIFHWELVKNPFQRLHPHDQTQIALKILGMYLDHTHSQYRHCSNVLDGQATEQVVWKQCEGYLRYYCNVKITKKVPEATAELKKFSASIATSRKMFQAFSQLFKDLGETMFP